MNGVIITGMEMPTDCFECERRKKCCGNSCSILNIKNDCPLKPVDGLIEKCKEFILDNDDDSCYCAGVIDVMNFIKEYCEVTK